jgi:CheY-like chemotaxis protein
MIVEDLARRISLALERIQLYRQAQEANRLKDEFLSTLSHELRTPLNVVYGWARILRMGSLDGQTAHAIDVIERNAEAQLRLIEDVLDVSRIIAGKMRLTVESLSIRDVLATAVEMMRPAAEAKGVRVEASLDQDLGTFSGDPHRLQQVFSNLLSNAVKFTRAGDLITVALQRVGEWAEVRIADTGIGIRREVLPYVFDRFRQADSSTTRRHGGLGLGLSIARQIVELHGGIAAADSAGEGHGATFTIRLPLTEAGHDPTFAPAAAEGPTHAIHPRPLHGRKVLVVEDHDDARELVARVLGEAGAEVISARSTAEALESLTVTRPDLLLADLGLPFEDGYTLLQRVRAMTWADHQTIPAVALTAYARASDRERAIAAGFLRYIVKPVDPAELVDVLSAVLESRG